MSSERECFCLAGFCLLRATPPQALALRRPSEASQVPRPEPQKLIIVLLEPRSEALEVQDPKSRLKVQNGSSGVKDPRRGLSHGFAQFTPQNRAFFSGFGSAKNRSLAIWPQSLSRGASGRCWIRTLRGQILMGMTTAKASSSLVGTRVAGERSPCRPRRISLA